MSTKQKVYIVTGAGGGIGCSVVKAILAADGRVCAVDLSQETLDRALEKWIAAGFTPENIITLPVDVTETDGPKTIIETCVGSAGKLHVLINCAGITRDKISWKMEDEDFDAVHAVNLRAPFRLCREAARYWRSVKEGVPEDERQLWSIVNISSVNGLVGVPGQANYCASKSGLIGMTRTLALEYARIPIRVNAVAPGYTRTELTDRMKPEALTQVIKSIPLGRLAAPEEIAQAVLFIAHFPYATGAVFAADGGITAQ